MSKSTKTENQILKSIEAVFEGGILKPLGPLGLPEGARVTVTLSEPDAEDWMDTEFMDSCSEDSDPSIRLEEVRAALSKIQGSMDEAVDAIRGQYWLRGIGRLLPRTFNFYVPHEC